MELLKESHRRSIMILVSVSLLSLVFSSLPLLFRSLNQFSINKSYVFLFCNGLMVFIAKNSSLPSSDSSSDHHQFKDLGVAEPAVMNSQEHDDNMVAANSPEPEVEEEEKRMIVAEGSHEEDEVAADAEKEWVDETEIEDEVADTETKEEEEEENEEVEELNKKCEDFIRKMKAAFCSEPSYSYHVYSDADNQTAMVTVR